MSSKKDLDHRMRIQHLIDEFIVAEIKQEANLNDWPVIAHADGTLTVRSSGGTYYSLNMHMSAEFIEYVRAHKLGYKELKDK